MAFQLVAFKIEDDILEYSALKAYFAVAPARIRAPKVHVRISKQKIRNKDRDHGERASKRSADDDIALSPPVFAQMTAPRCL